MEREHLGRPTIRAALLLGFGLIFGIQLFTGYYFTRRIADFEGQATVINARYVRAPWKRGGRRFAHGGCPAE